MKFRILIADDEPLARERIRSLLKGRPEVAAIIECHTGQQTLERLRTDRPDLVFLDIQMPERSGFDVLSELDPTEIPAVIFVTAYDQFALKAFEVHAVDYLLKPFDRERFEEAFRRGLERVRSRQQAQWPEQLAGLLREWQGRRTDRIAIKKEGRLILIRLHEIDWIEAADNYVEIHAGGEVYLHRETLSSLEQRLTGEKFVRISRSVIVNLDCVRELQPMFHGDYAVLLKDGTHCTLSRKYRENLQQLLGRAE